MKKVRQYGNTGDSMVNNVSRYDLLQPPDLGNARLRRDVDFSKGGSEHFGHSVLTNCWSTDGNSGFLRLMWMQAR